MTSYIVPSSSFTNVITGSPISSMWTEEDDAKSAFDRNDLDGAIQRCREQIWADPSNPEAHVNYGVCLMKKGEYRKGWQEYEWRLRHFPELLAYGTIFGEEKRWGGFESIEGKRLVVFFEQGFGDCIQFARFLRKLKQEKCHIIAVVPEVLMTLFRDHLYGADEVWSKERCFRRELPEHDWHVASMSLPYAMSCYEFFSDPYICAEARDVGCRVGAAWVGSNQENDPRPCGEWFFRGLGGFVSLNPKTTPEWAHCPEITDFSDTAKIIAGLDLVISIDTAALHLAGAMGKRAIGLLPFAADFRWGMTERSPWYPSIQLLRQPSPGDWWSVREQVKELI